MQRSSELIGAIASALAKAQSELTNPEKSLIATIRSPSPSEVGRTFRYASLSSGLDIVRKTLGKHEIATVQTTSIDKDAGLIRLTTVLAHSSGEWVSSDWPVCPVGETAAPHRMGAALTYARRYSLFTLVGIAGEDDLDAPNLEGSGTETRGPSAGNEAGSGQQDPAWQLAPSHRRASLAKPISPPEELAILRERLISEIQKLVSAEHAVSWARQVLPVKNSLTVADAQLVEEAFRVRIARLESNEGPEASPTLSPAEPDKPQSARRAGAPELVEGNHTRIDKSALSIPEPRRLRDKAHVKYVSQRPCLICGRQPSDPHHLQFAQQRALGRKVSDEFTVPLCRSHHREVHRSSDEAAWWRQAGVDALIVADNLWRETHPVRATTDASEIGTKELDQQS